MSVTVRVWVDPDSSFVHQGTPWEWLDWSEAWKNEPFGLKVSNGNAPPEYCPECVYRVSSRIQPAGAWDPDATLDEYGDLYIPPVTVLNGRPVLSVRAERNDDHDCGEGYPDSGWDWVIELGDAP